MQTFALVVAMLLAVLFALFLLAGVVAIRLKSRRLRIDLQFSRLWLIVQATVARAEAEWRPRYLVDGKLTPTSGALLKEDVVLKVRELGRSQLSGLAGEIGVPRTDLSPIISGLIERAVSLDKAAPPPAAPPAP